MVSFFYNTDLLDVCDRTGANTSSLGSLTTWYWHTGKALRKTQNADNHFTRNVEDGSADMGAYYAPNKYGLVQ